jgi:tungstate transport system substrate-binding protein
MGVIARRGLLAWPLAAALAPAAVARAQPRPPGDALRIGADTAVFDSGLAARLQRAFGRDTGLGVHLVRGAAVPILGALERGELDVAIANAPQAEERLLEQGLAHDRQALAEGEFVLVGPAPQHKARDPAGIVGGHDGAAALAAIRDAAVAAAGAKGGPMFVSAADGSGAHMAEQALWRRARIAPGPPWYVAAEAGSDVIAQARARGAYALVERGAWWVRGGGPLAVLVDGDPQLVETIHVLRAFRATHPAGKLFVAWLAESKGRRVVAETRGYRTAGA